ncbi:hypothetical protein Hanom_Chr04g00361281 [Helianthus anomalus]
MMMTHMITITHANRLGLWLSCPHGPTFATISLPVAMEVQGQGLEVVLEPELAHCPKNVFSGYSLPLLALAPVISFASHEADELGNTFLDCLFGIIRDLGIAREDVSHDTNHVCYRHQPVLFSNNAFVVA